MAEYTFGTHAKAIDQAEAIKSKVWGPVPNRAGLLAGAFFMVGPQAYANVQPVIQQSPRAAVLAAPKPQGLVSAAPQFIDLTVQAVISRSVRAGAVYPPQPRVSAAPQADPTQISPVIQASLRAVVIIPNPVAPYYSLAPQLVDLTLQPIFDAPTPARQGTLGSMVVLGPSEQHQVRSQVWPSVRATAIVPNPITRYISAAPQQADLSLPSQFYAPLVNGGWLNTYISAGPDTSEFHATFIRPMITASSMSPPVVPNPVARYYSIPPQMLDTTIQPRLWRPTPLPQGNLGKQVWAAPIDTTQVAPLVWASLVTPPILSNPVAPYYSIHPQRVDLTLQPVISRPRLSSQGRVPPMINAGQQTRDLTPPSQVYPISIAAIVHGLTLRQHMFVPEQANLQPNPSQIYAAVGSFVYPIDGAAQYNITVSYGGVIVYSDGNGHYFTIPRFPTASSGPTSGYLSTAPAAGSYTNFNPSGFGPTIGRLDVDTTAGDVTLVSIIGTTDGQVLTVANSGPNNLILTTGFRLPSQPFVIPTNDAQQLTYYAGSINEWCMS